MAVLTPDDLHVPQAANPLEQKTLSNEPNAAASPSPTLPQLTAAHITCSRGMAGWLHANQVSLAFTSYQTGRLYLVGVDDAQGLAIHEVGTDCGPTRSASCWRPNSRSGVSRTS
jgi:hypothetical protein